MAVKVWLPLSGDTTTNKGLSAVTTTVTGTPAYAAGILGGNSFTSGAASVGFTIATAPTEFSISFWVKEGVSAAVGTSIFTLGANGCKKTATGYTIENLVSSDLFELESGWNHVAIVSKNSKIKAYVNGVAGDELTQSGSLSANTAVVIGGDWAGNISDFKYSDNALSLFEVKAEAQGLVVNYGFNGVQSLGTGLTLPNGTTAADWGFGDKEYDLSGNEFDATYGTSKPTTSTDTPMYSAALTFTGANALVTPVINTTELSSRFTVSVWAKASGTIATFANGGSLSVNDSSAWHLYVVTGGKLYVDGEEDSNLAELIGSSASNTVTIGGSLTGAISDFRIYATELTAAEITSLYKRRVAIDNTGKVVASEFIAVDEVTKVGYNKKGIVSAPAIVNYNMKDEEAVDVTKFAIAYDSDEHISTLNAVDVIEY